MQAPAVVFLLRDFVPRTPAAEMVEIGAFCLFTAGHNRPSFELAFAEVAPYLGIGGIAPIIMFHKPGQVFPPGVAEASLDAHG